MNAIIIGVAILWGIPTGFIVVTAGVAAVSPRARETLRRSLAG